MENKKLYKILIAAGTAALAAGAFYFVKRFLSETDDNYKLVVALSLFKEKKYQEALKHLNAVKHKTREAYEKMYECYKNIFDAVCDREDALEGAVSVLDKLLEIFVDEHSAPEDCSLQELSVLVTKRMECYQQMYELQSNRIFLRNAFKDAFILTIASKHTGHATEKLAALTRLETLAFSMTGKISPIKLEDYFAIFSMFYMPVTHNENSIKYKSKLEEIVRNGKFKNLKNSIPLKKSNLSLSDTLISSAYFYISGDITKALSYLNESSTLESLFFFYFSGSTAYDTLENKLKALDKNLDVSTYYTALVVASKCYSKANMLEQSQNCILRALEIEKNWSLENQSLINLIKCQKDGEAVALINKLLATREVGRDTPWHERSAYINFLCIGIEYSLRIKNLGLVESLYEKFTNFNDTRMYLFGYIIASELIAESNIDCYPNIQTLCRTFQNRCTEEYNYFLESAIECDSLYFKNYLYYGNYQNGTKLSLQYYKKALECASTATEIYSVFHVLIVTEVQLEVFDSLIGQFLLRETEYLTEM